MDWTTRLASRIALQEPSKAVTEILKLAERPDIISFAGGLPDPTVFRVDRVAECAASVLESDGPGALNYGANPGYSPLRDWIADRITCQEGIACRRDNVLVTSGGLEALHLVALALLEKGSTVLVGAPTYLTALHVFRAQETRIRSVEMDDQGMVPGSLTKQIEAARSAGESVSLIYIIPSFQNPMGVTAGRQRREEIVEICTSSGIPIVEDHAYAELWFEGGRRPSLYSLAPDNVILIHTFSKIFGPGVRLGWVAAPAQLTATLALCKLGTDQCANTLTQRIVLEAGQRGWIDEQIESARELYSEKRDATLAQLKRHLPTLAFTRPEGGFYTWGELPAGIDSARLLERAIATEKVAFVAGGPFFADGAGSRFVRLSYSFVSTSQIAEGIERLARVIEGFRQ